MIAYEAYFPFRVTDVPWQTAGCLVWLACDLALLYNAHRYAR